uniref:Lipase_3 domain-containing protein n=1 Tax=Macrostomum lignano TaxID=282301 RepID=A0A1I8F7S7_9PLAT
VDPVWRTVAPMRNRRCRHGVAALGDKIYVAGGYDGLHFSTRWTTNEWTLAASLNALRSRGCLTATWGKLYAIGSVEGVRRGVEGLGGGAAAHRAHEGGVGVGVLPPRCGLAVSYSAPMLALARGSPVSAAATAPGSPAAGNSANSSANLETMAASVRLPELLGHRNVHDNNIDPGSAVADAIRHCYSPRLALVAGGVAGYWLAASSSCSFAVLSSIAVAFVAYALAGGWRYLRAAVLTFPRDFRAARCLLGTLGALRRMTRLRLGIVQLFAETVAKQPEAVCFRYEDEVANLLLETGHSPGQVVALFARVASGIRLSVAGHGQGRSLVHCLRAAEASSMLFGAELAPAVKEVAASLAEMRLYRFGDGHGVEESLDGVNDFDKMLAGASGQMARGSSFGRDSTKDRLHHGAAQGRCDLSPSIRHDGQHCVGIILNIGPSDSVYDCLPLYHTAGASSALARRSCAAPLLLSGGSSPRPRSGKIAFKYNGRSTSGELCRYLLAQPSRPSDQGHRLRLMFGNGLRAADLAREFQRRFGVSNRWASFMGATESNCNLINLDNTRHRRLGLSLKLVKVDQEHRRAAAPPVHRTVQLAGVGEPGETRRAGIVRGDLLRDIDGYVSKAATEKKVLRNVLRQGDAYFSTGDVAVHGRAGIRVLPWTGPGDRLFRLGRGRTCPPPR